MVSKEEEKNYKKPKISKIWNFLIYGSTIAIGVFLIWLYSAYIFINKWKKVKKSGNIKRRNSLLGKVGNVSAIIELFESWSKYNCRNLNYNPNVLFLRLWYSSCDIKLLSLISFIFSSSTSILLTLLPSSFLTSTSSILDISFFFFATGRATPITK